MQRQHQGHPHEPGGAPSLSRSRRQDQDADRTENGAWTSFEISGEKGSDAVDDATIQAHCETEAGALLGEKQVTVFHFDQAKIEVNPDGIYGLSGGRYRPG